MSNLIQYTEKVLLNIFWDSVIAFQELLKLLKFSLAEPKTRQNRENRISLSELLH